MVHLSKLEQIQEREIALSYSDFFTLYNLFALAKIEENIILNALNSESSKSLEQVVNETFQEGEFLQEATKFQQRLSKILSENAD